MPNFDVKGAGGWGWQRGVNENFDALSYSLHGLALQLSVFYNDIFYNKGIFSICYGGLKIEGRSLAGLIVEA